MATRTAHFLLNINLAEVTTSRGQGSFSSRVVRSETAETVGRHEKDPRPLSWHIASFWLILLAICLPASGQVVLFDGSLGTTPSAQGWPFFADPLFSHSVTQTALSNFTVLDTVNPITDRGGYFSQDPILGVVTHPNMPVIDPLLGFAVDFTLRIAAETHVTGPAGDDNGDGIADRSGFSVIAIGENLRGLELGFWSDRIWAQDDDAVSPTNMFTQAEGQAYDTTAALVPFQLRMFQDAYSLVPRDGVAPILRGRLRDYTNFTGSLDPYEIPSFLFFGDNTTRGESISELGYIAVANLPDPCQDADALVAAIVSGTNQPQFDLTGDGLVNGNDLTMWLAVAGEFYLGAGRSFRPGDANLDGVVDGSDFGAWNANKFTATAAWCSGDFNADGAVDGSDFGTWNANKFQTSDMTMVPEPMMPVLFTIALSWLAAKRQRPSVP